MAWIAIQTQNNDYNLTQPMVWLNSNAKNSYKYRHIIFKYWINPLRRAISFTTVFPKDQASVCSYPYRPISADQQSILYQRLHPCHPLSNHPWIGTDRNKHSIATEWGLPISGKPSNISESHYFAAVSGTFRLKRSDLLPKSPRPLPRLFSNETRPHLLCDLRSRYQSPDRLWRARGSQSGFQPKEARTSLLSAPSLFRGKDRRYLGRGLPLRGYSSSPSHRRDSGQEPFQVAFGDSRDSCEGRLGFLRPYYCRVSSRSSCFLCHCGQNHQTHSTILWGSALRGGFSWVLGLGVRIQTLAMENDPTLHRDTPSHSRKAFLATFPLQDDWLYLPCDCHQSFVTTPEPMAFLQSESHRRTYHSRTSRSLYAGQNPYQRLGFQSGLFSLGPFCLQLGQLVQTSLSTGRMATAQSSNPPKPPVSCSSTIASPSRTSDFKFAEQLSIFKNICRNFKKDHQIHL